MEVQRLEGIVFVSAEWHLLRLTSCDAVEDACAPRAILAIEPAVIVQGVGTAEGHQ